LGQRHQDPLLEAEFKEFLLIGLADDFELIEFAAAECFQHLLLMMFQNVYVSQLRSPIPLWKRPRFDSFITQLIHCLQNLLLAFDQDSASSLPAPVFSG
jgi:hypothetical protein